MQIHLSKTLQKNNVLNCNKEILESKLKAYDSKLYLEYNYDKECWQVRRLPDFKYTFHIGNEGSSKIFMTHFVENDFDNHILNLQVLSYDVLDKLRSMDMWENPELLTDSEYNYNKYKEEQEAKHRKELKYNIRQYRKYFADVREEVRSGRLNPFEVFTYNKPKRR